MVLRRDDAGTEADARDEDETPAAGDEVEPEPETGTEDETAEVVGVTRVRPVPDEIQLWPFG